ncbi:DNA polymerase delta subunit 3-like [Haliotis cracherodii]|uniref:DNA polymerase delta subunit 3-like n=1 Tax=Haliotis cracherodii TaxID=6455 RepID=UPI0039EC0457
MAVDEYYMENLDEFVNDENKVVTFKWLSTNLKVHVNQAKQMLYAFVQQERNKRDNDKLSVTYFVAGIPKTKNGFMGHKCCVVSEEELGAFKSTLTTVTSCHIYSVQKVKLKDSNSLFMADYDNTKEKLHSCSSYSAISYPRAKARSKEELAKLGVQQSQPSSDPPKTNGSLSTAAKPAANGSAAVKAEPKGSIASMFSTGGKKKEAAEKVPVPAKGGKGSKGSKAGGVMSFFSNQTAKPSKPVESKPVHCEPVETKPDDSKPVDSKPVKNDKPKSEPPKEKKKTDVKKSRPSKGKKSTRVSDSDEDKPDTKRRRRIRNDLFDSSSSEDEMEVLEESPVPSPVRESSPEPESPSPKKTSKPDSDDEPVIVSQTNGGEKRRKRTRKLVPKTSMDADGFMVTEKVWESDSTDASEREEDVKKQVPSPAKQSKTQPTKKASPQKKSPAKGPKNQMSLMSFFKKK